MRRNGERITELGGLVSAMRVDRFGSNKTHAEVKLLSPTECIVREHFDDGKGHSGAFFSTDSPVDMAVFEEALKRQFITGKLEPGYVSTTEFVLTRNEFLLQQVYVISTEWDEKDFWRRRSAYEVEHGTGPGTYVKIVNLQGADMPEQLRLESRKLVLPADPAVVARSDSDEKEERDPSRLIYTVPRKKALKVIYDENRAVHAYWEGFGFPRTDVEKTMFFFHGNEVVEMAGTFIRPGSAPAGNDTQ